MSENDKNVTSRRNEANGADFFQKRGIQGFIFEIMGVVSLLEEKFIFLTPLGQQ